MKFEADGCGIKPSFTVPWIMEQIIIKPQGYLIRLCFILLTVFFKLIISLIKPILNITIEQIQDNNSKEKYNWRSLVSAISDF